MPGAAEELPVWRPVCTALLYSAPPHLALLRGGPNTHARAACPPPRPPQTPPAPAVSSSSTTCAAAGRFGDRLCRQTWASLSRDKSLIPMDLPVLPEPTHLTCNSAEFFFFFKKKHQKRNF